MRVVNRRANYNFLLKDRFEAGVRLIGSEVKSIKDGHLKLDFAYVKIIGSEAYLVNADIPPYPFSREKNYDPKRTRKLLLHKKEIIALKSKIDQGKLTIVPTACYTTHGFVKLELALAKAKKAQDKRETLKKRDLERQTKRDLRGKRIEK